MFIMNYFKTSKIINEELIIMPELDTYDDLNLDQLC